MRRGRGGARAAVALTGVACCVWCAQPDTYTTFRQTPATTERITQRLEQAAARLQAESQAPRTILIDLAYPRDKNEYRALDGNGVLLISALARDRAELPLKRVLVVAGGKTTALTRIGSVLSDQTGSASSVVKAFGAYRQDVLCLLPVRFRMQAPADVAVELGSGKGTVKVMSFATTVPPQISEVVSPDTTGNGPSEQALDSFIRRELPGVLDPPRAKRSKPVPESELNEIASRGRLIAQYDVAAWHATDAVRALAPQAGSTTHYIAMEDGGIWTVFFGKLDDDGGRFLIAYAAVQERDRPTQFNARKLDAAPKDAGPLLFRARAIQTARADFGLWDRPHNVAVIPATGGQLYVYVMPAQTEEGVFPLGGDVRYLVSQDGKTIREKRQMHRTTIEFHTKRSGEAGVHTAVLDDAPEDTDVFHVLARQPSVPEWVLTPRYAYRVEADGSVRYAMTSEALTKIFK